MFDPDNMWGDPNHIFLMGIPHIVTYADVLVYLYVCIYIYTMCVCVYCWLIERSPFVK